MHERKTPDQWKHAMTKVLDSKYSEFKILGYDDVTKEALWSCLHKQYWKNNPRLLLYENVADILQLVPNTFMNYLTHEAYQTDDLFASIAAVTEQETDGDD